jgi:hypothetical protein
MQRRLWVPNSKGPKTPNLIRVNDDIYGEWYGLLLEAEEDVCIQGCAIIAPIRHGIRVYGYEWFYHEDELDDTQGLMIYSSKSHSFFVIESLYHSHLRGEKSATASFCAFQRHAVITCRDYFEKNSSCMASWTIVAIRPWIYSIPSIDRINPRWLLDLFGNVSHKNESLSARESLCDEVNVIPGIHVMTSSATALVPFQSWVDRAKEWSELVSAGWPVVIAVCGGKGVGKSSFCRFVVNWLLNIVEKVYYIDTDLGQSEASPSGLISWYDIKSPLLGPPFTHLQTPVRYRVYKDR